MRWQVRAAPAKDVGSGERLVLEQDAPESSPTGRHRSAVSPVGSSASSTAARSVAPGGAARPSAGGGR
ncbi:hypothetical protein STVIR_1891 [Streptomyces viridochromogenes Tue57]|uniref:Uncharacterized protein n=1 Tax=Streptomyces viridochromogenes Tue57 TaxID=1160705 RepID=L8PP23_STRVR|nr:hypothetical protein STVIR_1891 [Streptomyces viridochromogenes Tue57]